MFRNSLTDLGGKDLSIAWWVFSGKQNAASDMLNAEVEIGNVLIHVKCRVLDM